MSLSALYYNDTLLQKSGSMQFNYNPISRSKFNNLASVKTPRCITIYVPTYKSGKELNQRIAQGHLRSCINKAKAELSDYEITEKEISDYLQPLEELHKNIDYWMHPSDGLVLFLSESGLDSYKIPIPVTEHVYVSDHFYLKPLTPLFSDDHTYYVLELSQDYVKLYQGSRYKFEEHFIDEFTPEKLQQTVGFDYKQKMFQFRSGQTASAGAGTFHGHGEGKDESKLEIEKFFRAIDSGLQNVLHDKRRPLLISCVDYLFPIYKSISNYQNLINENLSGDPEFRNKKELHAKSWQLIYPYVSEKSNDLHKFEELKHTSKTSVIFDDIIAAAAQGKVDILFMKKQEDRFGSFEPDDGRVSIDNEKLPYNESLLNLAAIRTLAQGGKVYELEADTMPDNKSILSAVFRF